MKKFKINEKEIELSDKTFFHFYLKGTDGMLVTINFDTMLTSVQSGKTPVDKMFEEYLHYLSRWVTDAPRKRFNRKCRLDGMIVLTTDELFDTQPDGEQII